VFEILEKFVRYELLIERLQAELNELQQASFHALNGSEEGVEAVKRLYLKFTEAQDAERR